MADKLSFVSETDDFIEYYSSLIEALEYNEHNLIDYDAQIMKKEVFSIRILIC